MKSKSESYASAGVDITAGYEAVKLMGDHVKRTRTPGMLADIGGFGGAFALPRGYDEPVLISGTDGVGTKLKLAFIADRHDTVGIDCVAMCVNDIICAGAKPLFFLDYIATGRLVPEKVASIVSGVAEGCVQAGCALVGGETAEMPGFYPDGEYDLAGFAVGVVEKSLIYDKAGVKPGDALIAFPSSGVHSNGFSLVRKVFDLEREGGKYSYELGATLIDTLLAPTNIYVKAVDALSSVTRPHALAHITGGGFHENIPRMLPAGVAARIEKRLIKTPPIFALISEAGSVPERDMFNTFNMGVGMCAAVDACDADAAVEALRAAGTDAYIMGEAVKGDEGVELW